MANDPIDTSGTSVQYVGVDPKASKTWGRANTSRNNPGANAYSGASSLTGKQKADASAVPASKADATLDAVIKGGVKAATDWQTRDVDHSQLPASHGLRSRQSDEGSPGGTVPATTGHSPMADEARRRAERLKG